ncbi:neprilysin-11-like [Uloborus diversus]|uniref:neprilysin-11-like n=1 Tax=Uloborus diversus TaxID=327109 RepID=UPI00240A1E30|nr:neprilysin-11-like [Uloborus diversus]
MEDDYIENGIVQSVNRTFLELKRSFARALRFFGNTDDRMSRIFFNKLNAMKLNTGYQNAINDDRLDEVYNALEVGDDYFRNVLHLKKFKARYFLMRLWYGNGESQRNEISLSRNPLGVEASYDYITNTVNIDLGLLLPPVLLAKTKYPKYLKYGPSSIIAREMSHAFDTTGIFYDADGNKIEEEFWPQILLRKYEYFVSCLRNQLLLLNDVITEVNATEILNQVIADLGSFDISYKMRNGQAIYNS